ncbi:amidinotransferase [Micromonospora noduli]|uniref:Scyllo-inosamine-4-phosphate amidinotransferase n=1 Tax=Micromonospora noduli TaxID=709876 RepID=A0A328NDY5_9ACTN|nr:inosamine-phosphate amidinotransferase 1 [Micromonospora noduli]KAB1928169.1 inosamine-phosphate amidinotransferase 1 [Micromonospora noduli]RAO04282.1 Scyllo-inosamine-4-phosphate amidinotransferase [Micromonospora noduli]RAO08002.1 Scyllo-inosamine-4-phosphate amidinotransferase [Micromonospora noduli]RAO11285.1 Scyllo-inosamine-4-phosphate amidinotransferase [Micromonospora noduli]RAO25261.1 Scyllo-inosamine-4-phosphate amidinotransferase [Micromonospora noduli]
MTHTVWSVNDWDPLEEVVLGSAAGLTPPPVDVSLRHFFEPPADAGDERIDAGTLQRVVDETEEDFAELTETLTSAGVRVRRPDTTTVGRRYATPEWESVAMHALMPRDCLLVIGDRVIEAPMPMRARYFETAPFRSLLREYFDAGASWFSAPKPLLPDETYVYEPGASVVAEDEPLFDAANMLRCGTDIFFNVSNTGNRRGAAWLRRQLGSDFRVHEISICSDHVGTTLHILRPGLLLANSERLTPDRIPGPLRSWKTIWVDTPEDDGYAFDWPRASVWVGMNILALGPDTVVVPANQTRVIKQLENAGITAVPTSFRHGRTFGGGLHCCSLDVRRRGGLETYL